MPAPVRLCAPIWRPMRVTAVCVATLAVSARPDASGVPVYATTVYAASLRQSLDVVAPASALSTQRVIATASRMLAAALYRPAPRVQTALRGQSAYQTRAAGLEFVGRSAAIQHAVQLRSHKVGQRSSAIRLDLLTGCGDHVPWLALAVRGHQSVPPST